jgi:excisionase family DNA binding protein
MPQKDSTQLAPPASTKTESGASSLVHGRSNADPLYSEAEAGKYLEVSPKTLSVWRCTKRYPLPFVKIGSRVRYRRSDLDAFIASRTQSGGGAE